MDWSYLHLVLFIIQRTISTLGILVIVVGILLAIVQYFLLVLTGQLVMQGQKINHIRLNLGRSLILGLEFIVAADLIGTTTTPDYYALGLLVIIVAVRTLLSFSINRELMMLSKEET